MSRRSCCLNQTVQSEVHYLSRLRLFRRSWKLLQKWGCSCYVIAKWEGVSFPGQPTLIFGISLIGLVVWLKIWKMVGKKRSVDWSSSAHVTNKCRKECSKRRYYENGMDITLFCSSLSIQIWPLSATRMQVISMVATIGDKKKIRKTFQARSVYIPVQIACQSHTSIFI